MARVTVEDCLGTETDQFALVHLATARYRQLHRGARRLVDSKNKDIVTSLREIAAGKVSFRENVKEVIARNKRKLVSQRLQQADEGEELDTATPLV